MTHELLEEFAFELDGDGEFTVEADEFGNQSLKLISGGAYLQQSCRIRLTTQKGELVLHPAMGFPVRQSVGVFNAPFIKTETRNALLADPDIAAVPEVEVTLDGRTRSASVVVVAVAGDNTAAKVEETLF